MSESNTDTQAGQSAPSEPFQFLIDLIDAPSPSGYEQPAAEVFRAHCVDNIPGSVVKTDVMGNVYATLKGSGDDGATSVMLAGHIDEIGFQVHSVHKDGYLYFDPVGGHDAAVVVGQRVIVHTAEHGPLPGAVGRKAIHLLKADERGKAADLSDMIIDIGAVKGSDIADIVRPGDPITFAAPFQHLLGDLAVSHAFDDKTGAYIVAETLRLLVANKESFNASVTAVATVQEEIGLRGARTSGYALGSQVGIAVDVYHASDYPGAGKRAGAEGIRCGGGPIIFRGANINPEVYKRLVAAADAEDMDYQIATAPGGTGTDANAMQIGAGGMATGIISIPLRYMHTPGEIVALKDVQDCARLLARFVAMIEPGADFTPTMANYASPKLRKPAEDETSDAGGVTEQGDSDQASE